MKVGLLCGREHAFPPAFLERVNRLGRPHGVTAEFVKLAGTRMGEPAEYRVIVDRISHEIEYFRAYLKHAVLAGTYVINNPFWWTADDKYFNYSVAAKLGIAIPKTDRKSTRLNSSHGYISYAVFCLKKKNNTNAKERLRQRYTTMQLS